VFQCRRLGGFTDFGRQEVLTVATRRRDVLIRGGSALLGAAGLAALPAAALPAGAAPPGAAPRMLFGRAWRISSRDVRKGELPAEGVRLLIRGELYDAPTGGRKLGEFYATAHRLGTLGKAAPQAPGSLELHTFVLAGGTLVGSGVASAAAASEGEFAIVGGTGRYVGARGSYRARQSHRELGGTGTATFSLQLIG
jgi:hypothetical protein